MPKMDLPVLAHFKNKTIPQMLAPTDTITG
jgi:hypothetical protein